MSTQIYIYLTMFDTWNKFDLVSTIYLFVAASGRRLNVVGCLF